MQSLILDEKDYWSTILPILRDRNLKSVSISSFMAKTSGYMHESSPGVLQPVVCVVSKCFNIINELKIPTRVLLGVSKLRLTLPSELIAPNVKIKQRQDLHLKCWIFEYSKRSKVLAITGGRNLSASTWIDASIVLDNKNSVRLLEFYNSIWVS